MAGLVTSEYNKPKMTEKQIEILKIGKGWEYVGNLPSGKVVIRKVSVH